MGGIHHGNFLLNSLPVYITENGGIRHVDSFNTEEILWDRPDNRKLRHLFQQSTKLAAMLMETLKQ